MPLAGSSGPGEVNINNNPPSCNFLPLARRPPKGVVVMIALPYKPTSRPPPPGQRNEYGPLLTLATVDCAST
ncbi:hypothetical protein ZHAS_00009127 [Anopheles sinensis]|uniref:Uncharacterized protein n=1 Tax=Anopheles sinensis TaxID=74873 RepID=A0A084VU78_ANOSI|nr:hypothetical protein ZHAS_00009127 [Anopheles sinensis]